MGSHNQNKHPTPAYCTCLIVFAVIAGCIALSHYIFGNWGVM